MGIMLSRSNASPSDITWDNLQNKPSILLDDQINWSEIQNKPVIEHGTFTPKLTDTTNFNYTHSEQEGFYTKIDNTLFLNLKIAVPNAYRNILGFMEITDLPFTFNGENRLEGYFYNVTFSGFPVYLTIDNTNIIKLMWISSTANSIPNLLATSHLRSGANPFVVYMSGIAKITT